MRVSAVSIKEEVRQQLAHNVTRIIINPVSIQSGTEPKFVNEKTH